MKYNLPVQYSKLSQNEKRVVREQYTKQQGGLCMLCKEPLDGEPHSSYKKKHLNMKLFPPGFLKSPVHLQHDHSNGLTEGAIHAHCNGVLWQYYGR